MTDQTPAQRLRCFLAISAEEGADDDTPILDIVGFANLTFGDLHAVLDERDQLAAKLAVATRTVAAVAMQRNQLARRVEVVDLVLPVLAATVATTDIANARDAVALILLALDRAAPSGGTHPVMGAPAAPSATNETDEHPFEPQQPAQRLDAHKLEAIRRGLRNTWAQAHADLLITEIDRLNTEVEQLQVELGYALDPDDDPEPPTLADVDPDYHTDQDEADRTADLEHQAQLDDEHHDDESPF